MSQVIAGITSWLPDLTVGLIATLTTVACIIAADTGAYFVGKNLGRTKLTDISPKKTVEGALGGLASAVAVAVLFWKLFSWPGNIVAAAGYGVSEVWAGARRRSGRIGRGMMFAVVGRPTPAACTALSCAAKPCVAMESVPSPAVGVPVCLSVCLSVATPFVHHCVCSIWKLTGTDSSICQPGCILSMPASALCCCCRC